MATKSPPKLSGLLKMGIIGSPSVESFLPDIKAGEAAPLVKSEQQAAPGSSQEPIASTPPQSEQFCLIPIERIEANPIAPREIYTPEMLLRRADELRTQGQHDAIHVIPHPDRPGYFIIADGWTRVQACRIHKALPALKAEVHHGLSVQEAAWFGYEQNEGREQHCDFDRASFYEKLIAEGISLAEVARRANVSKTLMTMYRSYAKLPDEILQFVKDKPHKIGARAAYELNRIYEAQGARKAISVAAKFCDEDQTYRWLVNQTQSVLHPSSHKAASALKHIRYANGFYKQKSDAFELSIQVPAEKRESFAAALEALLNTVAIEAPPETLDTSKGNNSAPAPDPLKGPVP